MAWIEQNGQVSGTEKKAKEKEMRGPRDGKQGDSKGRASEVFGNNSFSQGMNHALNHGRPAQKQSSHLDRPILVEDSVLGLSVVRHYRMA